MSNSSDQAEILPVVSFLKIPDVGEPYLEGLRCTECGAVFTKPQKTLCQLFFQRLFAAL